MQFLMFSKSQINKILSNKSAIFVGLSLFAAGINYLYYPAMSHIMSVNDFGASQALITILTQAGSVFAGLSLLTIYLVKVVDSKKIASIINSIQKIIVAILILATIILASMHSLVSSFLNINDNLNIIIVALDLIVSIPFVISYGYLLAKKRFMSAGLLQICVVSVKLLTGVTMAYKFGVIGAIAGVGVGYIMGIATFWCICKLFKFETWEFNIISSYRLPSKKDILLVKPYAKTVLAILVISTCLVIYPSCDVIVARHSLSGNVSGLYAAASTLSSIVLFASLPLVNTLTPYLNLDNIKKSISHIKKTMLWITGIGLSSILILIIFPRFLLSIFGSEYIAYANILWIFGLNMLLICLLNVILQVIALYKPLMGLALAILGVAIGYCLASIYNTSALSIITSFAITYAAIFVAGIILTRRFAK